MSEDADIPTLDRLMKQARTAKGLPAPDDLAEQRKLMAAAISGGMWTIEGPVTEATLGGVHVLRFMPVDERPRASVLHFHGGAFRNGCPEMIGPFAESLVRRCGVEVVCPRYRLAPEFPFPQGLLDAHAVLSSLQAEGDRPIILSGDSAGGGFAASLSALAGEVGAKPLGLVLLSPWLDLSLTAPSFTDNAASDPIFSKQSAEVAATFYLQGHDAGDPMASPLCADPRLFPPTYVGVGTGEVLADDARRFGRKLSEAGIEVSLSLIDGMEHVAVTRDPNLPGSTQTLEEVAAFVNSLADRADQARRMR